MERFSILDFQAIQFVDHVATVHINCDNVDNLHSFKDRQISCNALDQLFNSCLDHFQAILNGAIRPTGKFFKGACDILLPHDLSGQQGELSAVILDPKLPGGFSLPEIRSCLCLAENLLESFSHLLLQIQEVVFNSAIADEKRGELDFFSVLGNHPGGHFGHFRRRGRLLEGQVLESLEAIAQVLAHFGWVGPIGQDGEQRLVRQEVESGESLFLLLQVVVQTLFASLDVRRHLLQHVQAFHIAGLNDLGVERHIVHHFSELRVDAFEHLGVLGQLRFDIL